MAQCVRERLATLARESVAALGGEALVREALGRSSRGASSYDEVWAVGKAAAAMARGAHFSRGIIISKESAGHPIPDERGLAATHLLLSRARALDESARVLLCLSGGASALLAAPVDGVSLEVVQAATRALMASGAPIGEINVVRRHLGAALGGKLAAATRARLDVLALSDVVGDDPAAIGSGPASPDASTLDDALAIARARDLPPEIIIALQHAPETRKPGDPVFARVSYRILASPLSLRDEAARRAHDFTVTIRPQLVTGPVESIAEEIAALRLSPGELWLAVGEPTIAVRGNGRGGRAQHLALLVARALVESGPEVAFVALGSDGSDGPTAAAGAAVDGDSWSPAAQSALERFDSHTLLDSLGATLVTGPTGTNLTDLLLLARAPRT